MPGAGVLPSGGCVLGGVCVLGGGARCPRWCGCPRCGCPRWWCGCPRWGGSFRAGAVVLSGVLGVGVLGVGVLAGGARCPRWCGCPRWWCGVLGGVDHSGQTRWCCLMSSVGWCAALVGIYAADAQAGTHANSSARRAVSRLNQSCRVRLIDTITRIINYLGAPFGYAFTELFVG